MEDGGSWFGRRASWRVEWCIGVGWSSAFGMVVGSERTAIAAIVGRWDVIHGLHHCQRYGRFWSIR